MTINFYLQNLAKNSRVYVYLKESNLQFGIATSIYVQKKQWNIKQQSVKSNCENYIQYNNYLEKLRNHIRKIETEMKLVKFNVTLNEIVESVKNSLSNKQQYNFFDLYDKFIQEKTITVKSGTITHHKKIMNHLRQYESYLKKPITMNQIDSLFLEKLEIYFYQEKKLNIQTTNKDVKTFKEFLNWLLKHKYLTNDNYKMYKPKRKNLETDFVILTSNEIELIYNTKFESANLERLKDLFVFMCYTAVRFIDGQKFQYSDLYIQDNNLYWKCNVEKTTEIINIPIISKIPLEILKKYESDKTIYQVSNPTFNKEVKEICRISGITEIVSVYENIGTDYVKSEKPKFEFITAHTSRRSCITNLLISGISETVVRQISGHKSGTEFQKYVKISKQFTANELKSVEKMKLFNNAV